MLSHSYPPALLGIDLGASSLKASLIAADDGRVLAQAQHPVETHIPQPGWSEQDPEQWYVALSQALVQLLTHTSVCAEQILAIGISAGAHIPVLLDDTDQVIRPAIMWNDQRSAREAAQLREHYGEFIEQTSLNRPNPTWTLAMLKWLQTHEPDSVARVRHLCLPKDYLRWRLTGQRATDFSDVIGALMGDVTLRTWSEGICALIHWPSETLPAVLRPTDIAGYIIPSVAQTLGLKAGTPVVTGSNDTTVELFGVGCIESGAAAIKLATAGVLSWVVDQPVIKPPISCYPHIIDSLYYLATGTNACASAHRWVREKFFSGQSFADMDAWAAEVSPGSEGLLFHPYLQGERGPHWDPDLRADFLGLTMRHERSHVARAVYEGIAYSIRDILRDAETKGFQFSSARVMGGGARSLIWRQILADVTGLPLQTTANGDASFGTALVAGIGIGVFADEHEAIARCVKVTDETEPKRDNQVLYDELFELYRESQQSLVGINHRLARLFSY